MPAPRYQPDKFRELILYLAERSEAHPRFGETKLNKLLFYSDFIAYRELGRPITGARYQRLRWGPAAVPLMPVQAEMEAEGQLVVRTGLLGTRAQQRPIALRSPDLSKFNGAEIALVDDLIEELWDLYAVEVSDRSHELPAWQVAADREIIPYETAYVESIELLEQAG